MTDREKIQRALSPLHASDGTLEEVLKMIDQENKKKNTRRLRRTTMIALAAAFCLMGTALAVSVSRLRAEPVGDYGLAVAVSAEDAVTGSPKIRPAIVAGYLPEGMSPCVSEDDPDNFFTGDGERQIYVEVFTLDVDADQVQIDHSSVSRWEELTIGGNPAVCLEETEGTYTRTSLYMVDETQGYVVELTCGNIQWDEVVAVAEGLTLESGDGQYYAQNWSEYVSIVYGDTETVKTSKKSTSADTATAEEMANTHAVGEEFAIRYYDMGQDLGMDTLTAKVVSVDVSDNLNSLDAQKIQDAWHWDTDDEGNLLPQTLYYYTAGDGVDSIDELGLTLETEQKLVTVTVEYKNVSSEALDMVHFWADLAYIEKTDSGYAMVEHAAQKGYDKVYDQYGNRLYYGQEMKYHDGQTQDADHPNYIEHLEPEETATVHFAWVVNADELNLIYLSLDSLGSGQDVFGDTALENGYVDITQ
jgi:hypothetical protein